MTYEEWASIGHANGWLGVRNSDPTTSKRATKEISVRAGSQRHRLLACYATRSMTDEEAGRESGLAEMPRCCYWKRCSELRQAGLIRPTWETRLSSAGVQQQVCCITPAGFQALAAL